MVFDKEFKLFLGRCTFFVIAAFLCIVITSFFAEKISPVHEQSVQRKELFEAADKYDSVIFGNSHTLSIYLPDSENIFHLFSSAEDVYETFGKLSYVIESDKLMRCAIVNISPLFYLHSNIDTSPDKRYKYYYLWGGKKLGDDSTITYLRGKLSKVMSSDKLKSVLRKLYSSDDSEIKDNLLTNTGYIYRHYFFDESVNSKELAKHAGLSISAYLSKLNENEITLRRGKMISMMRENLTTFKNKELKFIFVTPPYLHEYFPGSISNEKFELSIVDETQNLFSDLQAEFDNVEYYSFLGEEKMLDETFYYNDHMNVKGATEYTKLLKQRLVDNNLDCGLD